MIELSDKPLTIIYSGAKNLATNLLGEGNTIGIRVTDEPFSKNLCARFRKPIVSTSANISGKTTPHTFAQIDNEIIDGVDYVVNFRQNDNSLLKPSSILKLGKGNLIEVIRQ